MFLKYVYDTKLAQASYLVGCQDTGEAIVIDPSRDVSPYLDEARRQGFKLIAAAETHIHADFVSGARALAERGAKLYLSDEGDADWKYQYLENYPHQLLKDDDTFKIGNIRFDVWHVPGHTPEHLAFILTDTAAAPEPMGIFTGDFVFVGSVGRPDLLEKSVAMAGTAEIGARQMFHSLKRFRELPEYLQVWPGHGAGSACGKGLGSVPSSTVGYELRFNPALRETDEDSFVNYLLSDQPDPPPYFAQMKRVNKEGPSVEEPPSPPILSATETHDLLAAGAPIIDVRRARSYASKHLPGTINLPFGGDFMEWVGWLIGYDEPFYVVAHEGLIPDVVRALHSIGLENIGGVIPDTMVEGWQPDGYALQSYDVLKPDTASQRILDGSVTVIDVRRDEEWEAGHLPGASHIMLGYLQQRAAEIPQDKPIVVQCASGARSAIGTSILQAAGFENVSNLLGGYGAWVRSGLPVERE